MARQRKGKQPTTEDIPLEFPADTANKNERPLIEIPEDEQRRLINHSGVLKKFPRPDKGAGNDDENTENVPLAEEIFNAILYIVPFSFVLLMMDIAIHYQYGNRPTSGDILNRMTSGVPILSIFIFYALRYKSYRVLQIWLFIASVLAGSRMIYLVNHANWLTNIKQCPPLATLWIFTVVQLDLGPAVLALLTVGSFVWWKDLKIIL